MVITSALDPLAAAGSQTKTEHDYYDDPIEHV
jgi:hypothetical protein